MARVVLLLLAVTVTLVAADFSLEKFKGKFQKGTPYTDAAVAHVKPFVPTINALPKKLRDRLADCLYSAALNAKDMDSSETAMFSEIGGCLSAYTDSAEATVVASKIYGAVKAQAKAG